MYKARPGYLILSHSGIQMCLYLSKLNKQRYYFIEGTAQKVIIFPLKGSLTLERDLLWGYFG